MRIIRRTASGGAPTNPNTKTEFFGRVNPNAGTPLVTGAVANTKGSWVQLQAGGPGGALQNDITDLVISIQGGSSASARYLVDIGVGDGTPDNTTVVIDDIWAVPTTGNVRQVAFLLNRFAGERVWARAASNSTSVSLGGVYGRGIIRQAGMVPRFNTCSQIRPIAASLTNALPNTKNVTVTATPDAGWTEWVPSVDPCGALALNIGLQSGGTTPSTTQNAFLRVGKGAGAPPAELVHEASVLLQNSQVGFYSPTIQPVQHDFTGQRLSFELLGGTAGANDIFAIQAWKHN